MEKEYIDPYELRTKFRSKSDLWKRMSIDCDIFLPSYQRCTIDFMKKILAGKKKFLKNKEVIYFEIPKYPELATKNIWPLIKENDDLMAFFPDLKELQLPEKEFMYGILCTLRPDSVRELIATGVKNRSPTVQEDKGDLIEITKELKDSIMDLYSLKTTRGRANFLLKKSSILNSERRPSKKYNADLKEFIEYRAENNEQENNDPDEEIKDPNDSF